MEARQHEYQPHAGLSSPYTQFSSNHSEPGSAHDSANPGQYHEHVKYEPDSARPGAYANYIAHQQTPRGYAPSQAPQQQQQQQPPPQQQQQHQQQPPPPPQQQHPNAPPTPTSQHQNSGPPPHSSSMAQTSPSSSLPPSSTPNGHAPQRHSQQFTDPRFAADPSIAASSPTYPPHQQYSPYPPQHEMPQYPGQPAHAMYGPRPDWQGHYGPQPMYIQGTAPGGGPGMVAAQVARPGGHPMSTVYSFVPIPGSQQHKRPRRRYEEIERMYKCGWNGCEKAYGTLNHLNAHVTMQAHGSKRTPEEFKEIRKEWKAKKKEEDQLRKQDEERQRTEGPPNGTPTHPSGPYPPTHMMAPIGGASQLPPIGYVPAPGQAPVQYAPGQDGQAYQAQGPVYANGYPPSPYGQQNPIYQQHPEQQQQAQSYQQQ